MPLKVSQRAPATASSAPGANAGSAPSAGAKHVSGHERPPSLESHTTRLMRRCSLPDVAPTNVSGGSTLATMASRLTVSVEASAVDAAAASDAMGVKLRAGSSGVTCGRTRAQCACSSRASAMLGANSTSSTKAVSLQVP